MLSALALAQQPNGAASMYVQHRQGPPYPIVANAPNNGILDVAIHGPPGAPYVIATGPLSPGAAILAPNQSWDLGTPPLFLDVTVLADGTASALSPFVLSSAGIADLQLPMPPSATIALPPIQAYVVDPSSPSGFSLTAASCIQLLPSKNALFVQGDFDPGIGGLGPHCRLSDTSLVGYSQLRDLLLLLGFNQVTEVVDTAVTITPQVLGPLGVLVLGSNRRTFATAEVDAIEAFVRAGGGLVSYSDFMFGPGAAASDNQTLTRFGLLAADDNFGGQVLLTSFNPHPISAGLPLGVRGEGVSIIEIVGNATDTFVNVAPCLSNGGACLPYPGLAPSGSANPTYSGCAAVLAGVGRVAATFDRNTFFNYPGYGSNLFDASNLAYAANLFLWAAGY